MSNEENAEEVKKEGTAGAETTTSGKKKNKKDKAELSEEDKQAKIELEAREALKVKIKNSTKKEITALEYATLKGLNSNTHWYLKKSYPKEDKRTVKEWTVEFKKIKLI